MLVPLLGGALASGPVVAADGGGPSKLAPPRPAGVTRVIGELRPFISLTGNGGGGAIADLTIEHHLRQPLKLWLALAPVAASIDRFDAAMISHARLGVAYASDLVELGVSAGSRIQNFSGAGVSVAAHLRLGAVDGLNLAMTYGYLIARSYYSGDVGASFSNVRGKVSVPISSRARLYFDGAFSYDVWLYAIFGLEQAIGGSMSTAPWRVWGGFGAAYTINRFGCEARYPAPCEGSSSALGLTFSAGIERRF